MVIWKLVVFHKTYDAFKHTPNICFFVKKSIPLVWEWVEVLEDTSKIMIYWQEWHHSMEKKVFETLGFVVGKNKIKSWIKIFFHRW